MRMQSVLLPSQPVYCVSSPYKRWLEKYEPTQHRLPTPNVAVEPSSSHSLLMAWNCSMSRPVPYWWAMVCQPYFSPISV